jgi:hypothetical protein
MSDIIYLSRDNIKENVESITSEGLYQRDINATPIAIDPMDASRVFMYATQFNRYGLGAPKGLELPCYTLTKGYFEYQEIRLPINCSKALLTIFDRYREKTENPLSKIASTVSSTIAGWFQ